jgi:general secretion pathway protein L
MSTLTVALPPSLPDNALELGYVLSHDGRTVTQHGLAPLALLPKADTTVLVVPAQKLSYHPLTLPQAPKARLRAALEGLLEDRLLDAPETQALAIAPDAQARRETWVASCDKAWLQAHLAAFEQAGLNTRRIVPQVWPQAERLLVATGSTNDAWLVRADASGVLASPLASAGFVCTDVPQNEGVLAPAEISQLVEQTLGRPVQLRSASTALLASLDSPWDLAQFDIRLSHSSPWGRRLAKSWQSFAHNPVWRWARWGLGTLLLGQVMGVAGLAWQENHRLEQKKNLQTRLFTQTFPQVKAIIDPSVQMQRELNALRAASPVSSPSDLEAGLASLGLALSTATGTEAIDLPKSLQYSAGVLSVKGLQMSPQAHAAVMDRLQAQGYLVNWQDDTLSLKVKP